MSYRLETYIKFEYYPSKRPLVIDILLCHSWWGPRRGPLQESILGQGPRRGPLQDFLDFLEVLDSLGFLGISAIFFHFLAISVIVCHFLHKKRRFGTRIRNLAGRPANLGLNILACLRFGRPTWASVALQIP